MQTRYFTNTACIAFTALFMAACGSNNTATLAPGDSKAVQRGVAAMMEDIAKDVSTNGPAAWLRHFENTPTFFMAVDGRNEFENFDSAENHIKDNLVKRFLKITLRWNNIRVDPLTPSIASIGAYWDEDITNFTHTTQNDHGYFTATAEHTPQGWKLRNLHWSVALKE